MNKKLAIILVNYKHYAREYLSDCLVGIRKQTYFGDINFYIVDNASSEESYTFLSSMAPEAKIIRNEKNAGFAEGNNDAIEKALEDNCEYIVLFNMDTVIDENAVFELAKMAEKDDQIGAVQSRLMLWPQKDKINSLGNKTHFLGFGFSDNYRESFDEVKKENGSDIFYPSGAAVLFKSEVLKSVGLFDEKYWMYNEDQDLGWRIWLAGFRCVIAFDSVVYHKYEFTRSIAKYYFMDRNRIISILKNYHFFSLLLLFPAFFIMEIALIFFALKRGWFFRKIKVYLFFLNPFSWVYIIKERRFIQRNREIKDRELISMMSGKINYQEIDSPALRVANVFFGFYFLFFRFFSRIFNL
jgi:GT2 family glycosyltransferase